MSFDCFLKYAESGMARMSSGNAFHAVRPACEKARLLNSVRDDDITNTWAQSAGIIRLCGVIRYSGQLPRDTKCMMQQSFTLYLKSVLCGVKFWTPAVMLLTWVMTSDQHGQKTKSEGMFLGGSNLHPSPQARGSGSVSGSVAELQLPENFVTHIETFRMFVNMSRCVGDTIASTSYLSPVSTTRVDGPSWRVTDFHYPSTRAVLTGNGNRSSVNSGSGNRA